jgi:hypothetical protein
MANSKASIGHAGQSLRIAFFMTTVWKQEMPRHVGAFDPPTSADQSKMKTSIILI